MKYNERIKDLELYSLERRREWFLIINAWQQLEGVRDNELYLRIGEKGRLRCIMLSTITSNLDKYWIIIQHSAARQMEKLLTHCYDVVKCKNGYVQKAPR